MDKTTIILIGTTHETKNEDTIFKTINDIIHKKKFKNAHWLCEGESLDRQCTSLKDTNIHLLTDALFVNMLLIDKHKSPSLKNDNEYMTTLYERIYELFYTINKSKYADDILKHNDFKLCLENLKTIDPINKRDYHMKCITSNYDNLEANLKKLVKYIIDLSSSIGTIKEHNHKCVIDFYNSGSICEDQVMTVMREHSFIDIIKSTIKNIINNVSNDRVRIIITVGSDHVKPLSFAFKGFCDKIKEIIT